MNALQRAYRYAAETPLPIEAAWGRQPREIAELPKPGTGVEFASLLIRSAAVGLMLACATYFFGQLSERVDHLAMDVHQLQLTVLRRVQP